MNYEELAFKPELSWDDICKAGRNKGWTYKTPLGNPKLALLYKNGIMLLREQKMVASGRVIRNVPYNKMLQIIDAMEGLNE